MRHNIHLKHVLILLSLSYLLILVYPCKYYYVKINSYKEALLGHKDIEKQVNRELDKSNLHNEYIKNKIETEAYLVHDLNQNTVLCYYDSTLSSHTLQWIQEGIEVRLKHNKIKY